ncbi:hypothetical protein [Chamaesiphon sp.]|uniref:hypothetical protein n=1 Tax=Chamaesiphon sp. TaxID=2814140 RepID=UPI0035948CA1
MKRHSLLLTIFGNVILPIAAISGASAATLKPSMVIPDSILSGNSIDLGNSIPAFNPQGIQSILSGGGGLSSIFSGIVGAFPGLDPNIASALTTASKYLPIAQSVLSGQKPTIAQIGQVAAGINGGTGVGINFGSWGLDAGGKIQPLNSDGSIKTNDPTGKMIAYQASNLLNGKGLDISAVVSQIDLGKVKSATSVAEAQRQNNSEATASIINANGESSNSTLTVAANQGANIASAGSSFKQLAAIGNIGAQSLVTATSANTIGVGILSQNDVQAKYNALTQQRNIAEDEQKRISAEKNALANTYVEANQDKARAHLCASSNICWLY